MTASKTNSIVKTCHFMSKLHRGVSLTEMMIALTIFAVVIFPLSMLPMKAMEQSEGSKNTGSASFEIRSLFNQFGREAGQSYRFLPAIDNAYDYILTNNFVFNKNKQVFFAYWEEESKKVKRVGYQFRRMKNNSSNPDYNKWILYRAEIPDNASLTQYYWEDTNSINTVASGWKPATKIVKGTDFYIQGSNSSEPYFVFCRASYCNINIQPEQADGVKIQNGTLNADNTLTAGNIDFVFKNSKSSINPLYFKLASLETNADPAMAKSQLLPLSMAVSRWGPDKNWMAEKLKNGVYVPIEQNSDLTATGTEDLLIRDFHFNSRTGELLSVASSKDHNENNSKNGLYIFKSKPGMPDYKPYKLNLTSPNQSHSDPFPVIIHQNEPGALDISFNNNNWVEYLSVTQDLEDNIYVLAYKNVNGSNNDEFYIIKFSPQGEYISRFNLRTSAGAFKALGIAFNPSTPNEILALCQTASAEYKIRAYPKDQNTDNNDEVIYSAESPNLNVPNIRGSFAINKIGSTSNGLQDANITAFEYDPLHNRFLLMSRESTSPWFIQMLSLDADLSTTPLANEDDGTPAQRSAFVQRIYFPFSPQTNQPNTIYPTGLAFDAKTNQAYVALRYDDDTNIRRYTYYRVIPNMRLNMVY